MSLNHVCDFHGALLSFALTFTSGKEAGHPVDLTL